MENRTYLPVDGEIQTEENIGKYGESVAAYESVLAGEACRITFGQQPTSTGGSRKY